MRIWLIVLAFIAISSAGVSHAAGLGETCTANSDCPDPYCYPGPTQGNRYCLRADLNCALEGTPGVSYGYIFSRGDQRAACISKLGWNTNPQVDYKSDDFLIDNFKINPVVFPKDARDAFDDCLNNDICIAALAVAWPLDVMVGFTVGGLELSEQLGWAGQFRANVNPNDIPYRRDDGFVGSERKYYLNYPPGYSMCSLGLHTVSVNPPTGNATIADMTFSRDAFAIYLFLPRGRIGGPKAWWEGDFAVTYVKSDRHDHYRSLGICDVGQGAQNFLCRGNGTGGVDQNDGKGRRFIPCGNHNLAADAQY